MSRHNFTTCNSKNLSRNLPVQLFISISCSIVSEKLANRGIVWLSNGKGGGGLPGNTEAPLPTRLIYTCYMILSLRILSRVSYFGGSGVGETLRQLFVIRVSPEEVVHTSR